MIYYIYHIPGIKIGCTKDLINRMADQGFTEWEILEEHSDIYLASDREIQLQKDYCLPVDTSPYWVSVQNRIQSKEVCSRGGITQGNINASNGHMKRIQKENAHIGAIASNKLKRKLTYELAQEIRSKYVKRHKILKELSEEYGVSKNVICGIVYNKTYLTA